MRIWILTLSILSVLIVSCDKSKISYEVGISDVLHKTFFKTKKCNSDFYYNVLIRNDTIFIDWKLRNESGNHKGILNDIESKRLSKLIDNLNPKDRLEKEINPTTGMTALTIKKDGKTIDSLVDFKIKWSKNDLKFFKYIGHLICEKELVRITDSIIYPTWKMVKPPE